MDPYVIERNGGDNRVSERGFLPKIARTLRRGGHMVALIPFLNGFGGLGVAGGYIAEVADSVINGKFFKAVKQSVMGVADFFVTTFAGSQVTELANAAGASNVFTSWLPGVVAWSLDPISLAFTGKSAGELARSATGALLDAPNDIADAAKRNAYRKSVQQMPMGQVTAYNAAAMGWAPGMNQQMAVAAPGADDRYWFNQEAQRRGVDPQQAYRNFSNGNPEHVAALDAARERGPQNQQLA